MIFDQYAVCYDLYYADKDYSEEAEFVLEMASRFGVRPRTLLDMGCGTGRHLAEFARRGIQCDGFDRSANMLEQARKRLSDRNVGMCEGDIVSFQNGKEYDIVVSMFAVMGYLVDHDQLLDGLMTARRHLAPGGIFVFDGWFGPAVLSQKPEERHHEYQKGENTITRKAVPVLDAAKNTVTVCYEIKVSYGGEIVRRITEEHIMRLMFVDEMTFAMNECGLELVHSCPFMEADGELNSETWNIAFVARRSDA